MGREVFDLDRWDVKGAWDAENGSSHNQYYFFRSDVHLAGEHNLVGEESPGCEEPEAGF
jgi:hypothetical protein